MMVINKKGSVLIFSFWALIVLMLMSFGITRRVNATLSLTRYQLGKVRSRYAAFAGLSYVLDKVRIKQSSGDAKNADTLFACGVLMDENMSAKDLFSDRPLAEAHFDVLDGRDEGRFGLSDESGKININTLTEINYSILEILLKNMGVPDETARMIAAAVIDWKDQNDTVFLDLFGAEREYYQKIGVPYQCKNHPFETVEELLLIRGMTEEIFQKIRPYVTVYPQESHTLKVNFNTAPEQVLFALAQSVTGAKTNTSRHDAEDFVRSVIDFRDGIDGIAGTDDDREVSFRQMSFLGPRLAIASALMPIHSSKASFLRARIIGEDAVRNVKTVLDAVIKTDGLSVVSLRVQ